MSARWDWGRLRPTQKGAGTDGHTNNQKGYSYSIQGGPPPVRPPREYLASREYETTPPEQGPPRHSNRTNYRDSGFRPTSSLYSQPSAANTDSYYALTNPGASVSPRYDEAAAVDISPPSSPELGYTSTDRPEGRPVSPMEEDLPASSHPPRSASRNAGRYADNPQPGQGSHQRSSIPMMRRARRRESDAALREANEKEHAAAAAAAAAAAGAGPPQQTKAEKAEVRWDAMTGEPTTSAQGRPSQVHPADFAHGMGPVSSSPPSQQRLRSPTAAMTAFGDRVKRMTQGGKGDRKQEKAADPATAVDPATAAFSSSRPGWRGASGRTALVDPVRDNTQVAPLKVPRKSSKRVAPPVPASASAPTPASASTASTAEANQSLGAAPNRQTPPASPPASETTAKPNPGEAAKRLNPTFQPSPTPALDQGLGPARGQNYPSPPHSGTFDRTPQPDNHNQNGRGPSQKDTAADNPQVPIRRKPPPSSPHTHQFQRSSVSSISQQAPEPPSKSVQLAPPPPDPWAQPPSRFSVTTYATSSAATTGGSANDLDSDRPPVPTPPQQYRESPRAAQDSVMDRKRPKLNTAEDRPRSSAAASPIVISFKDSYASSPAARDRKAVATGAVGGAMKGGTGGGAAAAAAAARARAEHRLSGSSMMSDINKTLPPAPPEASADEARDRVGVLNAQLQGLGNRRINLNRCIKQMTELMPQDNVLDSAEVIYKREVEKKKVETLRVELADVQRQEYELGLKLHRAYKRMDRDADWERSALWVRRVTG